MSTGIKIKDCSHVQIQNSRIEGFENAIDAENTTDLNMEDNFIKDRTMNQKSLKWYKDSKFIITSAIAVLAIIVPVIYSILTNKM